MESLTAVKTDKVSVNLSAMELGQIDFLVEKGYFDNRSDFIRTSTRKALGNYTDEFKQFLESEQSNQQKQPEKSSYVITLGINNLSKDYITDNINNGRKVFIRVVGLLHISDKVTAEEIKKSVISCKVYGKLVASDEVKAALKEIEGGF